MTTLDRYEGMGWILARLEAVRLRHLLVQSATSAAGMATFILAGLVVAGAAGGYWPDQPPAALRWGLLLAIACAWAAALGWFVLLPVRRRLNPAQAARLVEESFDGLHNGLINAVQLAADAVQPAPALVASAIHETAGRTGRLRLGSAVKTRLLRRWLMAAGVGAVVLLALALFQGGQLRRGLSAVFSPTGYVAHVGSVRLLSLEPGDATCLAGEELTIVARIANPARRAYDASVEIAGSPQHRPMTASSDRATYSWSFGRLEDSLDYAVRIGDSKFPADKPYYRVTVLQQVKVAGLDLAYAYPAYTLRPPRTETNASGVIEAPVGTQVQVTLRLTGPVPAAVLDRRGGQRLPMRPEGGNFVAGLAVTADDAYRILLTDAAGRTLQQVPQPGGAAPESPDVPDGYFGIRAVPDGPPAIAFVEPGRDVALSPAGKLPVRLKVSDDYAITKVRFFLGREGEAAREVPGIAALEAAAGKTSAQADWTVEVADQYRPGETIVYYASATDNRQLPGADPQTTETPRFKIRVEDSASVSAERNQRFDALRARLLAILERQEKERVNTEIARRLGDLAAVRAAGKGITDAQGAIRTDILDLADKFPFEADMLAIQQALALVGNNEAAIAVAQARVLATLGELPARAAACDDLAATQDRIIEALQTMLAQLPSLANPQAAARTARGEDIPPEAKEALADLKADLEKFIQAERKEIATAQRLAKRPADNLSPQDEKLLRDLQAAQDEWEKFINEKFTDFSKLAQQDFANAQLLKELISVKTDVTMAKDALGKKAVEIATAIEDNGVENAETLTANIEKWLPDEPDRIKWDMEDAAGETHVEQPELPKELEDLVGDLLEEEEDLFDEMDDVTAGYAMSGDKGIGWDAMDGPISSMNAQGVTGNQLPNTSEISGRSGEGRQGKSLGEFVADEAVGKGGRRTPTRLTPEPFQQGQVNDTSQEPAGGATGGGKLSGAGSEGMEGPLAPELQEQMKRLTGRHAQLVNRAERLQADFRVTDYSNFQFLQAITLMGRVQRELDNYHYLNALRQRHVTVEALRQTRRLLTGEIDVTRDAAGGMPKYVKDDIFDAMKANLPPEYRDALQKYFQRLAETPAQ